MKSTIDALKLTEVLELIKHATAPNPDDGGGHEAAYDLACAALALARAEQAEPIYQYQKADGSWIDQTKSSYDYNVQHGAATTRILYATPPAPVPQPVQGEPGSWRLVPVEPTPAMLDVAVSHALMVSLSDDYGWTAYMREIWARMLKAAHGITTKEV